MVVIHDPWLKVGGQGGRRCLRIANPWTAAHRTTDIRDHVVDAMFLVSRFPLIVRPTHNALSLFSSFGCWKLFFRHFSLAPGIPTFVL